MSISIFLQPIHLLFIQTKPAQSHECYAHLNIATTRGSKILLLRSIKSGKKHGIKKQCKSILNKFIPNANYMYSLNSNWMEKMSDSNKVLKRGEEEGDGERKAMGQ